MWRETWEYSWSVCPWGGTLWSKTWLVVTLPWHWGPFGGERCLIESLFTWLFSNPNLDFFHINVCFKKLLVYSIFIPPLKWCLVLAEHPHFLFLTPLFLLPLCFSILFQFTSPYLCIILVKIISTCFLRCGQILCWHLYCQCERLPNFTWSWDILMLSSKIS